MFTRSIVLTVLLAFNLQAANSSPIEPVAPLQAPIAAPSQQQTASQAEHPAQPQETDQDKQLMETMENMLTQAGDDLDQQLQAAATEKEDKQLKEVPDVSQLQAEQSQDTHQESITDEGDALIDESEASDAEYPAWSEDTDLDLEAADEDDSWPWDDIY